MSITIVPLNPEFIPALGKICYDAFGALQERHHVEKDFDSVETATMVIGLFANWPAVKGFVALENGQPVGSNFITFADQHHVIVSLYEARF